MTKNVTTTEQLNRTLAESRDTLSRLLGIMTEQQRQLQQLQAKVAMLEKVTPMQAKNVSQRIRERAIDLEAMYDLPIGSAQKIMTLIRRQVRLETGARSVRDIARCDYPVVCELIGDWEDYARISALRQ